MDFAPDSLQARLLSTLGERGVASSAELQALTGKSQPTVSRTLASLGTLGVVVLGQGRRTRYALCRPILGMVLGQQPLFRHGEFGEVAQWGTLTWLGNGRVHVEGQGKEWLEQGRLPWFLAPLRLEGYLGRRWARRSHLAQLLGAELHRWGLEEQLYAALTQLHDSPGAFTLGDPHGGPPFSSNATEPAQRGAAYDLIVADENHLPLAGSSAAGEQAKFLIDMRTDSGDNTAWQALLVKFSAAPRGTPFGDRWHDLLHAEAMALRTLGEAGQPVSQARVIETDHHSYLESVRFDRVHRQGRRHAVALTSIHDAFVIGRPQHWVATCNALVSQKLLGSEDARRVALWRAFGHLIGNNDMHFGNLSLWADDPARPRFELAPCYDMLPMAYRPGEQRDDFGPTPLALERPTGLDTAVWEQARELAERFWASLADHPPCTAPFRAVAAANAGRLREMK